MRIFPGSALVQLEFDKVKALLAELCNTEYAHGKAEDLRIHTEMEFIGLELRQTHEFKQLLQNGQYFPNDHTFNLARELKLLGIPGAILSGEQFLQVRRLAESIQSIFRWFDTDRRTAWPALARVIENTRYEKAIAAAIDEVLDETGVVRDNA
ncbi:MAG TPA: DNA mismatch repair protein MutS, partial [Puia sp.]|nr:DNA mismatch repair protein MutS [Puia sp.]